MYVYVHGHHIDFDCRIVKFINNIYILNLRNINIFPKQLVTDIYVVPESRLSYIHLLYITHLMQNYGRTISIKYHYNIHSFLICSSISAGLLAKAVSLKQTFQQH